jgi:hypothetical protein
VLDTGPVDAPDVVPGEPLVVLEVAALEELDGSASSSDAVSDALVDPAAVVANVLGPSRPGAPPSAQAEVTRASVRMQRRTTRKC